MSSTAGLNVTFGHELLAKTLAELNAEHPDLETRPRLYEGRVHWALLDVSENAGLLVVGSPSRRLPRFGSVSQALLDHAICPIAVVPMAGHE